MKKLKFRGLNSRFTNRAEIILRDFLALERTTLANERTLFSYLRTSLYLILAGIGFVELEDFERIKWIGYVLFPTSAIVLAYGFIRYFILSKKLRAYYASIKETSPEVSKRIEEGDE